MIIQLENEIREKNRRGRETKVSECTLILYTTYNRKVQQRYKGKGANAKKEN